MLPLARKVQEHNVGLKNVAERGRPLATPWGRCSELFGRTSTCCCCCRADVVRGLGPDPGSRRACSRPSSSSTTRFILTLPVLVAFVPGLILHLFADRIVRRFGKRNTLLAAALLATITGVVMFLLGPSNVTVVVALMAIMSIPGAAYRGRHDRSWCPTRSSTPATRRARTAPESSTRWSPSFTRRPSGVSAAFAMFVLALGGWAAENATDFSDLAAQGMGFHRVAGLVVRNLARVSRARGRVGLKLRGRHCHEPGGGVAGRCAGRRRGGSGVGSSGRCGRGLRRSGGVSRVGHGSRWGGGRRGRRGGQESRVTPHHDR